MRITIIGSGNVATHMAAAFKNAGHHLVQIYSPTYQNAALLAYHVGAEPIDSLKNISTDTDLYVIAVKDDAVAETAKQLASYQKLLVHTSGSISIQELFKHSTLSGVFYPLQTFSKTKEVDFWSVPLCIEGADDRIAAQLTELAHTVSNHVYQVDSAQRKVLHLAAVFACNFPNYLYHVAQSLLAEHQLDFNLIRPLILETASKVQEQLPSQVQTGPAIRNDESTMTAHIQQLQHSPQFQQLYQVLSQAIIKMK